MPDAISSTANVICIIRFRRCRDSSPLGLNANHCTFVWGEAWLKFGMKKSLEMRPMAFNAFTILIAKLPQKEIDRPSPKDAVYLCP
ncbi:hypothetical protein D3C76_387690 [compost metagenome]